jgi:hypothetical protein
MNKQVANTEEEWKKILYDDSCGVIRTLEDWNKSLTNMDKNHPLYGIDESLIKEFTDCMSFGDVGLGHMNYSMLRDTLTISRFDNLMGMFGIGWGLMKDYNNKECKKRATCSTSMADICTSNC